MIKFLKENELPISILTGVSISFAIFLFITFKFIQPDTFLTVLGAEIPSGEIVVNDREENWKLLPLSQNFLSFFSSGISLPVIAPHAVKILNHPAVGLDLKSIWNIFEIIILILNILLVVFLIKYSNNKERGFLIFILLSLFILIMEVIIARPNNSPIPDYDLRYAGAPYYFYSIILATSIFLLAKYKKYSLKIIIPSIIILFSLQQAFSFHSDRLIGESKLRKGGIEKLNKNLISELELMAKNNQIVIPNLSGNHIVKEMPGFTLSNYLLFFNKTENIKLVQNKEMPQNSGNNIVETVPSLRNIVSKEFITALKNESQIKNYYSSPALLSYKIREEDTEFFKKVTIKKNGEVVILDKNIDPEKNSSFVFNIYTENKSGNLEISVSFKNDFNINETLGKIRIDDFTKYEIVEGMRLYKIEVNLLQIYPFSLSNTVSNIKINIPETKSAYLGEILYR